MPIILTKDKTKVKGGITWDHCWDILVGFCEPTTNHVRVSKCKEVVDTCHDGYNKNVDKFCTNYIRGFARIVMINLLHQSLP